MNPLATLLLLFVVVPLVEIYLLIKAGGVIGALPTVALVVLTAVVGAWLLRLQGLATLRRVQHSLADGVLPEVELVEGVLLLVAGALLLTPGFVTDAIGFALLTPPVRIAVARGLLERGVLRTGSTARGKRHRDPRDGGRIIEGEARRDDRDGPREP